MLPLLSKHNAGHVRLSDSESVGNRLLGFTSRTTVSYCNDIISSEFAGVMPFSPNNKVVLLPLFNLNFWSSAKKYSVIMESVLRTCAPFKVFKLVIRFVSIQMIHFVSRPRRLHESLENNPVNTLINHDATLSKPDTHVSRFLAIWLKNSSISSNSSKIADFVKSLKSRDWFPCLIHWVECVKPNNNNQQQCWV